VGPLEGEEGRGDGVEEEWGGEWWKEKAGEGKCREGI